jgi:low affinity Fe/Cu permease
MVTHAIRQSLTALGVFTAHPAAFLIVAAYGFLWFMLQPQSFDWHGVATLAVWLMTLLIQRAEHRDTQAIHAKLDELLHAQAGASNQVTRVDQEEPEDIEKSRMLQRNRD